MGLDENQARQIGERMRTVENNVAATAARRLRLDLRFIPASQSRKKFAQADYVVHMIRWSSHTWDAAIKRTFPRDRIRMVDGGLADLQQTLTTILRVEMGYTEPAYATNAEVLGVLERRRACQAADAPWMALARCILAIALLWPAPAVAWRSGWRDPPGASGPRPPFAPSLVVPPGPAPRVVVPLGVPLSSEDPAGLTYCLSRSAGVYFVCGYAPPLRDSVAPAAIVGPNGAVPPAPAAAALLVFDLLVNTAVEVDGVPIDLSEGLGAVSVRPGPHRLALRTPAGSTEQVVELASHAILMVTPAGARLNAP